MQTTPTSETSTKERKISHSSCKSRCAIIFDLRLLICARVFNRHLKKQNLGMASEKAKMLRSILEGIMENGANGRLARDCAPLNVTGITEIRRLLIL